MKRIAWIVGAPLLVALALLTLIFALLPRDALRTRVGEQIAAWTGRDVSLRGKPDIDLFPRLTVTLNDVQVAGPTGMADAQVVSMDRLRGTIRLLPLIIGRVEISSFTMVRPLIKLVREEDGARNWAFDSSAAALQLAFAGDVPLGDFVLEDGTLVYENRRNGVTEQLDSVSLKIDWPSVRQPLSVSGGGIWRGEQVSLSAAAGTPFAYLNGESTPVEAQLESAPLAVTLNGAATDIGSPRIDGALTMSTPSLRGFARWMGGAVGPGSTFGPANLSGAASFNGSTLSVEMAQLALDGNNADGALSVEIASAPRVTGTLALRSLDLTTYFDGVVAELSGGRDWREVAIETDWFRGLGADVRLSAGAVSIGSLALGKTAASVSLNDSRLAIGIAEAAFSGGTLAGELSFTDVPDKAGARVQAKLRATEFDLAVAAPAVGLPANLSGTATAGVDVTSSGADLGALVRELSGTARFTLKNGLLPLFGIAEVAVAGGGDVAAEPVGPSPVNELFAGFSFGRGTAILEQSRVAAANFNATATGWIALIDATLGLNGTVHVKRLGSSASQPVAFIVNGTLARPVARPFVLAN